MCIRVCACITNRHFGQKWQLCLPSCIRVVESLKCTRLRVHACVEKCVLRHWYSIALSNLWLNRSHHVCIRRPDRLCSFQPRCMLMPLSASIPFMLWTCICGSWCIFLRFIWIPPPKNCFSVGYVHASHLESRMWYITSARTETVWLFWTDAATLKFWC